jgi:hypothetical protein
MKKFLPILLTGIVTSALFVLCFLLQHNYYSHYGIDIKQWIEWDEWISLSFDSLVAQVWNIVLISCFTLAILKFQELLEKSGKASKTKKDQVMLLCFAYFVQFICAAAIVCAMSYDLRNKTFDQFDLLMALITVSLLAFLVLARWMFDAVRRTVTKELSVTMLVIIFLVMNSLIIADKKAILIAKSEVLSAVTIGETKIDSLTFLGSTRKYYFLKARNYKRSYILRKDLVDKITITEKDDSLIIL